MSVEQLAIGIKDRNLAIFRAGSQDISIEICGRFVWLDRNQADLLRLWLEEHLAAMQ